MDVGMGGDAHIILFYCLQINIICILFFLKYIILSNILKGLDAQRERHSRMGENYGCTWNIKHFLFFWDPWMWHTEVRGIFIHNFSVIWLYICKEIYYLISTLIYLTYPIKWEDVGFTININCQTRSRWDRWRVKVADSDLLLYMNTYTFNKT